MSDQEPYLITEDHSVLDQRTNKALDILQLNNQEIARQNVIHTINQIKRQSNIIRELEAEGKLKIAGGLYELETGKVIFSTLLL